ncbi:hypothetical protein BD769DRAFT_1394516 [Suillus cothurnatus]|nr:hypothetical protein BD769DRAFT_1394516 [Suillus cothurnatus]
MQSSTQRLVDWDLQLLHQQPLTAAFSQHVVWSSTKDNSAEVTATSPSQFTKVDPKAKPALIQQTFKSLVHSLLIAGASLLFYMIGITTKCLSAHQQKYHNVPALTAEQVSVLEAYNLHESDSFKDWDNSSPVVLGIPYQEGYMCTFLGCSFVTISKQCIQAHDRDSHHTRNNWKSCTV